jgi:hypothetical protein
VHDLDRVAGEPFGVGDGVSEGGGEAVEVTIDEVEVRRRGLRPDAHR